MNRKSCEDNVVLSYHECLLRESDVNLLMGPFWLNDQIISFYFEYLEKNEFKMFKKNLLFVSPEVTQCIKIVPEDEVDVFLAPLKANEKDFIFFPLNDNDKDTAGGFHWSLLVYSRPENSFFHFDSSNESNIYQCRHFVLGVRKPLNAFSASLKSVDCLQQSNGYDCGIHVLCYAENIAAHVVRTGKLEGFYMVNRDVIRTKRRQMIDLIQSLGGRIR